MTEIDVVMLSFSKNHAIKKMTQDAILSLHASSKEYKFKIRLVETSRDKVFYHGVDEVIYPNKKFNYNQFLNIGFEKCTSEFVVITNTDVIFHPNWFEEIVKVNADSATPFSPGWRPHLQFEGKIVEGYQTGLQLGGWCIVAKKSTLDKIGKFDEQFDMYHQDDDYARQLMKHGLVHKLVGTSKVTHLLGKTNGTYEDPNVRKKLAESAAKFDAKYKSTICLTMIVKDESKVILEALNGIYKFINYWVVVDTGSTDGTQEIIKNFFKEKGVPGELHEHPHDSSKDFDFGENRTYAFNLADGKADYMLVMDADDVITGHPIFTNLVADIYNVRHGKEFRYDRAQVFKSGLKWRYVGVRHEAPVSDFIKTMGMIQGEYTWISRTVGSRNNDPLKYKHDAEVIERALLKDPTNTRDWFYLGQSYFDAGDLPNAKRAYSKRVELGGWPEEVFYAQYRVGICAMRMNESIDQIILTMLKAYGIRPCRGESLATLAGYLRSKGLISIGYPFILTAAKLPYPQTDMLFVHAELYDFRALEELAIFSHALGNVQESYNLNKIVLSKKIPDADRKRIEGNIATQEKLLKGV